MQQSQRPPAQADRWGESGFREMRWQSRVLSKQMRSALYLPPGADQPGKRGFATLFLLHGSGHTHRSVLSEVSPQDHVGLLHDTIVVIPDGDQGWWLDSPAVQHSQYAQYVLELVEWVDGHFATARHRGARGICGFSMGGYGAMSLAAQHSALFGSASSLIGTLDIVQMFPDYHRLRVLLGGEIEAWHAANPACHAPKLAGTALFFCTAERAFDLPQNKAFARALEHHAIPFTFKTYRGEHDTEFVRQHLDECLAFHRRAFDHAQVPS